MSLKNDVTIKAILCEGFDGGSVVDNTKCKPIQVHYNQSYFTLYENVISGAWIMSLKHFHVYYAWHELKKYRLALRKRLKLHFTILLKLVWSTLAKTDQAIYLNHDFHDTSAPLGIVKTAWLNSKLPTSLDAAFQKKALVVRSLNELMHVEDLKQLEDLGFCRVASRRVYCFHPLSSVTGKLRYDLKRDLKLTEQFGYTPVEVAALSHDESIRLAELYHSLYIKKHTSLNPKYTPTFFKSCADSGRYTFLLFKQGVRVDGFCMFQDLDIHITKTYCMGYDTDLPLKQGLYRQIMSTLIHKSILTQKTLYLSAGASRFKKNRKCIASTEFYMVYYQHLGLVRRIGWGLLICTITRFWLPGIKKIF